jgi:hypothetical protein
MQEFQTYTKVADGWKAAVKNFLRIVSKAVDRGYS